MNSPIASAKLIPAAAELVKRVPPFADETTFNYVSRIACVTAAIRRRDVIAALFGSPTIRTDRPLHGGFGHLAAVTADAQGVQQTDLPQRLGMIALYGPFTNPDRYRKAMDLLHGERSNGINEIIGLRTQGVFRDQPAVCICCIREDISGQRPPYFRRTHQVSAVQVCPDHGVPLVTRCASCGTSLLHAEQPSQYCHCCSSLIASEEPDQENLAHAGMQWRLAKFIQATMTGVLPSVGIEIRLDVMRERAAKVIKNRSNITGDNLSRTLNKAYGQAFLVSLCLPTDSAPTLAWPSLLLQGRLLSSDPIANCVVMAALFDSVDDYVGAIDKAMQGPLPPPVTQKALVVTNRVTMSVLKDVLRPIKLDAVAKKHDINHDTLKKWVAAVPGLSERRLVSGARIKLRSCKKVVLRHLEQGTNQSRSQVATELKAEITFIFRNDCAWLDRHLPKRTNLSGAVCRSVTFKEGEADNILAARLRNAVEKEKSALRRPRRLYRDRVLRMSGLPSLSNSDHDCFPLTLIAVAEAAETVDQYYRRALEWAVRDLKRCYGTCSSIIQLFVHAQVGIEYVESLEPFARSLLATEGSMGIRD